jgi:uncharacterized membrane protein YhaH (DUF805 family)
VNSVLSFDGRIGRGTWWIANLVFLVVYFVLGSIMGLFSDGQTASGGALLFFSLLVLALSVVSLSFGVRRWHDLGKSGWWVCIALIPILGALYALVMQGFVAGDPGPNQYGPTPGEALALSPSRP